MVGNGHTNFMPMRSVSYDKGGGWDSRLVGLVAFLNIIHSMVLLWIRILTSLTT